MAKPNARSSSIVQISEEAVHVAVAAPPTEGKANEELERFLAECVGVRPNAVTVAAGSKSRIKLVTIEGKSPAEIAQSLQEQME